MSERHWFLVTALDGNFSGCLRPQRQRRPCSCGSRERRTGNPAGETL